MDDEEQTEFCQKIRNVEQNSEVSSEKIPDEPRNGNIEMIDNQDYNKMI